MIAIEPTRQSVIDPFAGDIFLDANATTQPSTSVMAAIVEVMSLGPLNAASAHGRGSQARDLTVAARDAVALLVEGCLPEGVFFTSGATEANNIALAPMHRGAATTILIPWTEHASVLQPAMAARQRGADVRLLAVDRHGLLDPETVRAEAATAREHLVVSVQWANSETGVVQPIEAIVGEVRAMRPAFIHSDAVQAVGRMPVDMAAADLDAVSLTAHKLHGPQGIGALIMRDAEEHGLGPIMFGGDQQRGLRPGTEPVHLAVAFGVAARERATSLDDCVARMSAVRDLFEGAVSRMAPDVEINGWGARRVPNTSNIRFPKVDGGLLVARLDDAGIRCSQGSACSGGRPEPSHVLLAMGLSERQATESVRFSFSVSNTEDEVMRAAETVALIVREIRERSSW